MSKIGYIGAFLVSGAMAQPIDYQQPTINIGKLCTAIQAQTSKAVEGCLPVKPPVPASSGILPSVPAPGASRVASAPTILIPLPPPAGVSSAVTSGGSPGLYAKIPGSISIPADFGSPSYFDRAMEYKWGIGVALGLTVFLGIASWKHYFSSNLPLTPPLPPNTPPPEAPQPIESKKEGPPSSKNSFSREIEEIDTLIRSNDLERAKSLCGGLISKQTDQLQTLVLLFKLAEIKAILGISLSIVENRIRGVMRTYDPNGSDLTPLLIIISYLETIRKSRRLSGICALLLGSIIKNLGEKFTSSLLPDDTAQQSDAHLGDLLQAYIENPGSMNKIALKILYEGLLKGFIGLLDMDFSTAEPVSIKELTGGINRLCLIYRISRVPNILNDTDLTKPTLPEWSRVIVKIFGGFSDIRIIQSVEEQLNQIGDQNNTDFQENIDTICRLLLPADTVL